MKKVLAVILVIAMLFSLAGCGEKSGSKDSFASVEPEDYEEGVEIVCPNFIGLTQEAVMADKTYNENFVIRYRAEYSADYPAGEIFEQSLPAERNIMKGATITLSVSMGTKTVIVPDVTGYTEIHAVTQLESQKFKVKVKREPSEKVAKDLVVRTDPAIGSKVIAGTEITVYISDGPPTIYIDVPTLVGLELEAAEKMIVQKGFVVGEIREVHNSSFPQGLIDFQNPDPANTKQAGKGTPINLYVSSGKTVYTSDVLVKFAAGTTAVSIWVDNHMLQEKLFLEATATSYTFKEISSENEKITVQIRIKNAEYTEYTLIRDVEINLKNGAGTVVNAY